MYSLRTLASRILLVAAPAVFVIIETAGRRIP